MAKTSPSDTDVSQVPKTSSSGGTRPAKPETRNQMINRLAAVHYEACDKVPNFNGVATVVRKAFEAGYSESEIAAGLEKCVGDKYNITAPRLVQRIKEARSSSVQGFRNPENPQEYYAEFLAAQARTEARAAG